MTYDELVTFFASTERPYLIHQALTVSALLDAGGKSTTKQLATAILGLDPTSSPTCPPSAPHLPVPTLLAEGVLRRDGESLHLSVEPLSNDQRTHLRALCSAILEGGGAKAKPGEPSTEAECLNFDESCRFCRRREEWTVAEAGSVWALRDSYPVTEGHHLVIPKRHTPDLFSMTARERHDADHLLQTLHDMLLAEDSTIEGFNVGMNCGVEAGQSVIHAHWHLIPRRKGDSTGKKGGVRGVIPERMNY